MKSFSPYQQGQIKVINQLEKQANKRNISFSTVTPVEDFACDPRLCLTSVHLPNQKLINEINNYLIKPLKAVMPDCFYYQPDSLHITIKNIRVINYPPHFSDKDIIKVKNLFNKIIPKHKKFHAYFYRLLLFPNNLALMGTSDPELDRLVLDLDKQLKKIDIPDDKIYLNPAGYFFCNMTLARFNKSVTDNFFKKVKELSKSILFKPYRVDSVTLLATNAVLTKKNIIKTWRLK